MAGPDEEQNQDLIQAREPLPEIPQESGMDNY